MLLCDGSLENVWAYLAKHIPWVFSGVGVVVLVAIISFFKGWFKGWIKRWFTQSKNVHGTSKRSLQLYKSKPNTRILFIDDDTSFKVVDILKAAGWMNTRIKEDISTLDDPDLFEADIVFVDIQGVGKAIGFKDDGLGLTKAIKERYPNKHVVVYSAESRGNRFHKGLKAADDFLSKTAQPYEFQKIVEDFVQGQSE